jgi:hypothetical protein
LAEHYFDRKTVFGLTIADVMRLACQLAVKTEIKTSFAREMRSLGGSG